MLFVPTWIITASASVLRVIMSLSVISRTFASGKQQVFADLRKDLDLQTKELNRAVSCCATARTKDHPMPAVGWGVQATDVEGRLPEAPEA